MTRNPGFFATATGCLGLALGLCTTTYALLDTVLNPHVPYRDPDRVFAVFSWGDGRGGRVTPFDRYAAVGDGADFHQDIAAYSLRLAVVLGPTGGEQRLIASVTDNLFSLLGVEPIAGRGFRPIRDIEEDQAAVISYELWKRMYNRAQITDAVISIDDRAYSVIGVMPLEMQYPFGADVWLRIPPGDVGSGTGLAWITPVVRLKNDVSVERANGELRLVESRLTRTYGTGQHPFQYELRSIRPDLFGLREIHVALAGAALVILLIACANLANLMLARGIQMQRDLALRKALGARRIALVQEVFAEAIVIALAGGAVGLLLSAWGVDLLRSSLPRGMLFIGALSPHFSWRVFVFALIATTSTLLLFGLGPAIRAAAVDVSAPLKDAAGTTTSRMRGRYRGLVIAEVALSMVLLLGAALLAKAVRHVSQYDFGFDPTNLYRVGVTLPSGPSGDSLTRAVDRLLERVQSVDGVHAAATMGWDVPDGLVIVGDAAAGARGRVFMRVVRTVSVEFLQTLGIPVSAGRDFTIADRRGQGAVIVDEEVAQKLWSAEEPVGRMLKVGDRASPRPWLPVAGVVRSATLGGGLSDPDLPPEPAIYVLEGHHTSRRFDLVVRTAPSQAASLITVRREIEATLPEATIAVPRPWLWGFEGLLAGRQFIGGVFAFFALLALALTAVGLYGVLAYTTGRRMREFGVRIALGARPRDLFTHVMHDGAVMVLAGTGCGALVAMWAAQILGTWLYDVNATDVLSLIGAEAVLFVVALAACLAPAFAAKRANPLDVLRTV